MLFNIHHIISDGWSFGVLFDELKVLYTAYYGGLISPLPKLTIQYADFTLWERKWLTGAILESQLNYWQQQLGGNLPILELPTDRLRTRVQSYQGAIKTFILYPELTASITSFAQKEPVTLFMTLLTAFKVLLSRYSGQEDVIVGTPIAGRNRREIEGLMGFFVNTLALRTDLGNNPSFNELLSRVRRVCLEAYTHQDLPFEQLVEVLGPERDLSHTPVFQVMFTLQNSLMGELQLPDLTVTTLEPAVQTAKFDLTVLLTEENGQLIGEWQYNTHLFDASTIERMIEHFQMLLSGILTSPDQKIWQLPLITEQERHQLLVEWNQTQKDYPHDKCIHHLFAEQAEKTPDAVAVVFKNQQITYGKLNQRANQLANYLQTLGVQPEVLVGIYTERSIEMVIGLLGILKAGGAYVPLDINYPTERIYRMLDDAKVGVLLTQKHLLAKINQLPLVAENKVVVGSLDEDIQDLLAGNSLKSPHCKNLAYVIYTSGSTGKPKGVGVEHGQLLNYVKGILDKLDLPTAANFATVSPFFADLGNTMICSAFCICGCIHIIAEEVATEPVAFTKYNQSYFLDCLKIVHSHLSSLLTGSDPEKLLPRQRLILAGEAASWELIKRVNKLAPKCQVFNH
jgi:non-ribosomal peptide synthetase component F